MDKVFDVAVVGCGAVGKCAALAALAQDRSVALIGEAPPLAGPDYALGAAAVSFLESVSVRTDISTPVRRMRIFPAAGSGVLFGAAEAGMDELCRIVPHAALDSALSSPLQRQPGLARFPSRIEALENNRRICRIGLSDGSAISACIVIGADGIGSATARLAGITGSPVGYGQCALTARFRPDRPAPYTAWQWFNADSVLAMLPAEDCVSMVWSLPKAAADSVLGLDVQAFSGLVESWTQGMLGGLKPAGAPIARKLFRLTRCRLAKGRVALAGDSAHGLHPLAGMGLNLGIADCSALTDVFLRRPERGVSALLRRYSRVRMLGKLAPETVVALLARRVARPSAAGTALESFAFGSARAFARCKSVAALAVSR